ncbi:monovalent cation/H(+) antiporter subunit G [Niallia sp. Sow4_A1]|uniref:Monovalent cation/H(+) antiporter subunit G n=1 Tax=Niallia hominis TaxID=3133173 RepID=A0ABV1EXQ9_9BACI|nr:MULTISPECIES: monovalent cation/H(+) antiporter subunit G [Bacillaceae]MCF2647908.1 Na+/H+ antiporter subunit G [Niallia circulans]MCM3363226.1 monovalent cation/H(+) antiporter subunit G [Niallia sp. MER TA 168]CAI9393998.1 Na(+)/H(+) antiporter subunit G [Bacillus sp. T2.9-1]
MSENNPIELIAVLLIFFGAIFCFLSSLGLIRLPDVYTRSHAASKGSTMGVLFTLVGTFVFFIIEGTFSIRLFLGIFFVFLTSPVASHVVVRSAYRSKVKLADVTVQDDLKAEMEEEGIETIEVQHK